MKTTLLTTDKNYQPALTWILIFFISITPATNVFSQEAAIMTPGYRNINAYLADFAKNELSSKNLLLSILLP